MPHPAFIYLHPILTWSLIGIILAVVIIVLVIASDIIYITRRDK